MTNVYLCSCFRVTVNAMGLMDFKNYPMDVQLFFFRVLSCKQKQISFHLLLRLLLASASENVRNKQMFDDTF